MITRRTTLGMLAATCLPAALAPSRARATLALQEPEFLKEKLADGTLPAMAERLPKVPRVVNLAAMGRKPGQYGGTARTIIGGQKDIRLMTINGYARLVGFDEHLVLQPDILESFEQVDNRIYTFKLREGHRWSDGHPFTVDDFVYYWEDVLNNKEMRPRGLPLDLLSYLKPPRFTVVDPLTVRYEWDNPNPEFLLKLASPQPLTLALPAHYMKQFHPKYADADALKKIIEKEGEDDWTSVHINRSRTYRPENPDLPTLDPWRNLIAPPAEQFIFERNPFFHRVDETGQQLPYMDKVVLNVSASGIIPAKAGAGETDLQSVGLDFADYTFLKDAEHRYPVTVNLWERTQGSRVALLPNLNCGDKVWRGLFRDVRFRRALSVAIDREEINKASFFGLARESADTILPQSPLFKPEYQHAWAQFDPDLADKLLDEAGLTERKSDGVRLLPDGRPASLIVESAGESTLETDVLELVTDHWRQVGLALHVRTSQRDVFRSRALGGEIMISVQQGIDNGIPTADMSPSALAPTGDEQLQWPVWGLHYLSAQQKGEAPDLPEAAELVRLMRQWKRSTSTEERTGIWTEMLSIYTQQVFSIGIVNGTLQPVVHSRKMQNVPKEGLYGFDPTAFLGVYLPDTFWFDRSA
ncbi:ABC transporter substrate-binding protein (plasmid) [Rhizobium sp. TRM96647]|uniref:ABC transporter substrate-binding protein n=1 Tax=unclassified Rhizobium TaxID=2613769 RepID=UPI0021E7A03C|nr:MULTISPECIES: ABC transporter substrate-binding protein [unclassified Rhizobium]MCV3735709.1 ABC transporter substrate-binding protein [Rhizobium sp. TRM96647]MCV3757528.1 ABC transporter substrate-binding protein [Rhizobium sp. TRM96650]